MPYLVILFSFVEESCIFFFAIFKNLFARIVKGMHIIAECLAEISASLLNIGVVEILDSFIAAAIETNNTAGASVVDIAVRIEVECFPRKNKAVKEGSTELSSHTSPTITATAQNIVMHINIVYGAVSSSAGIVIILNRPVAKLAEIAHIFHIVHMTILGASGILMGDGCVIDLIYPVAVYIITVTRAIRFNGVAEADNVSACKSGKNRTAEICENAVLNSHILSSAKACDTVASRKLQTKIVKEKSFLSFGCRAYKGISFAKLDGIINIAGIALIAIKITNSLVHLAAEIIFTLKVLRTFISVLADYVAGAHDLVIFAQNIRVVDCHKSDIHGAIRGVPHIFIFALFPERRMSVISF